MGKVRDYIAIIKNNEYDDVDIHDSIMEYLYEVVHNCKKDVLDFMKIAQMFDPERRVNTNTYWSLNVILSLALRKIVIKDIKGLEWCADEIVKSIGAEPIY